jgi:nitrogen fixation/metabolism regulation signal transduction histidine kinase
VDTKVVRRRVTTAALVAALLLAAGGLVLLGELTRNAEEFSRLYQAILLVNTVGAALLILIIGANLVRSFREYRSDVPGARLKVRLVTAIVALVIAPVAVVYLYSIEFLDKGIDSWFNVRVEQGLGDALELSRSALDMRMRDNMTRTRQIADSLISVADNEIYQFLPRLRVSVDAQELTVFSGGSRIIATSSANPMDAMPLLPTEEMLLNLRRDNFFVGLEIRPDDRYFVRTAVLLPGRSRGRLRTLQALYPLGKRMGPLAGSVEETVTRYSELSFLREPLKSSFILSLSIIVLVSLLITVYGAFFFARRLMAPVQSLVAGTRAVAQGDFDTRLPSGKRDEIGFLIDSFNDMIERLDTARSEARRSEAQVENERASLEAILARLSTGVIALEKNLTVRTANEAAGEILHMDFSSGEGAQIEHLAEGNAVAEQFLDVLRGHLDKNKFEWREQIILKSKSGRRVLVCACTALPGSYRSRGGLVVVFDDITELLKAQRDAAWGEVARRLAHEIKNPLTPIQLSAERLRRKYLGEAALPSPEFLERATHTIVQQVEAMRDMVNAFSEYARAPEMNPTDIDLNLLIRQVAELYVGQKNQPELELDLEEGLPDISVDAVRIRQVLHNVIRNALEALDDQEDGRVIVATRLIKTDSVELIETTVDDNGPGLPPESMEEIFDPYVTTKAKGTGLGLAIVRKLVEEHGGEVAIDSEAGKGAHVRIILPVTKAGITDSDKKMSGEPAGRRKSA